MIYELLSKRKKKLDQSSVEDVYQYDSASKELRVQIQQILSKSIGPQYIRDRYSYTSPQDNAAIWQFIHDLLCREMGVHRLETPVGYSLENEGVLNYLGAAKIDGFLDALEVSCRALELVISSWTKSQQDSHGIEQDPSDALEEINYRMREAGLGYAYSDGQLLRMDTEFTHEEVIKPALQILRGPKFSGPQSEFLQAHRYYRAGEFRQAITEAAKAFESTLKAVCELRGWTYGAGDRATDLLKRVRSQGLWPEYLDASFDQLVATLSSGLPKVRNEDGAHGQGSEIRTVPPYIAAYALNLAAAKIVLIAEAAQDQT